MIVFKAPPRSTLFTRVNFHRVTLYVKMSDMFRSPYLPSLWGFFGIDSLDTSYIGLSVQCNLIQTPRAASNAILGQPHPAPNASASVHKRRICRQRNVNPFCLSKLVASYGKQILMHTCHNIHTGELKTIFVRTLFYHSDSSGITAGQT